VVRPQHLLEDRDDAPVERLGFGEAALCLVQQGKVVERRTDIDVVRPQRLLAQRQDAPGKRNGLGVLAGLIEPENLGIERLRFLGCGSRGRRSATLRAGRLRLRPEPQSDRCDRQHEPEPTHRHPRRPLMNGTESAPRM
jgi:hypothetical protein